MGLDSFTLLSRSDLSSIVIGCTETTASCCRSSCTHSCSPCSAATDAPDAASSRSPRALLQPERDGYATSTAGVRCQPRRSSTSEPICFAVVATTASAACSECFCRVYPRPSSKHLSPAATRQPGSAVACANGITAAADASVQHASRVGHDWSSAGAAAVTADAWYAPFGRKPAWLRAAHGLPGECAACAYGGSMLIIRVRSNPRNVRWVLRVRLVPMCLLLLLRYLILSMFVYMNPAPLSLVNICFLHAFGMHDTKCVSVDVIGPPELQYRSSPARRLRTYTPKTPQLDSALAQYLCPYCTNHEHAESHQPSHSDISCACSAKSTHCCPVHAGRRASLLCLRPQ